MLCPLFWGLGHRKCHGRGTGFSPTDVQRRGNLHELGEQESLFPGKEIEDRKNDNTEIKEPKFGPSPLLRFGLYNK